MGLKQKAQELKSGIHTFDLFRYLLRVVPVSPTRERNGTLPP